MRDSPGTRLKTLRKEQNLTQEALASKIAEMQDGGRCCSEKQISYIENGRRKISSDYAMLFAEFFKIDVDWLLCKTDYRNARYRFESALADMNAETEFLHKGLLAFAELNGYRVKENEHDRHDIASFISSEYSAFSLEKDGAKVDLSRGDMNRLENEICDMVATRLKYLFLERGGS